MRAGIYARVASTAPADRRSIGLQLGAVQAKVAASGDEVVATYVDDGYLSLERPGLEGLRKAVRARPIESVWCWSLDRLAGDHRHQQTILDELARHRVSVRSVDAPPCTSALVEQWRAWVIAISDHEHQRSLISRRSRPAKWVVSSTNEAAR
jgi:DNA invertase Pin-like site-specific DNA recombinase